MRWRVRVAVVAGLVALASGAGPRPGGEEALAQTSRAVILSTTTSTQDSGLLDVLVPLFERQTGYSLKTVSVGTGQALALAARGEADVTLAHAPALEKKYVEEGKLRARRLVMYNDFLLVGPDSDPAKIRGEKMAGAALRRIAGAGARFVSRGDRSGTHLLELQLWKAAGVTPATPWYIESGQGMGATLGLADDRRAYTLTDRATFLAFGRRLVLKPLVEGDRALLNVYAVLEVNPANGPRVNAAGGKAFADFLVAPATQAVIREYGVDRYGQPLFVPIAGKTEDDLSPSARSTGATSPMRALPSATSSATHEATAASERPTRRPISAGDMAPV
jgi:tungstate transport system substrate-binding protein